MASSSSNSSCAAEQHNAEGSQAFKAGDYDTAYRCYSRAIKANPAVPKYWTNRTNTLFRLGRTRQVIDDADAAIKADPSWMKGYYFRGVAHERLGNLEQAIQALQQAAELQPSDEGVSAALSRCLEAKDAARRSFTAASTRSFHSDPARSAALLQQGLQDLAGSSSSSRNLSRKQLQQAQKFHKAHSLVIQADKLRYGRPPQLQKAAALYKQAGEMGSASGQFNYAQMIQHRQVDAPVAAAMPWLLKAATQEPVLPYMPGCPNIGVVESWVMLGDMYRDGLTGQPPDFQEAMRWYLKAAAEPYNSALAQNNLGRAYQAGEGTAKDAPKAVHWYKKAADQGYGVAEFNLAVLLCNGAPGVQQDHEAALELGRRAEQHGVAEAAALQVELEPSCAVAAAKLRALAEAGDPGGCLMLAHAYHDGLHGCDKDLQAANKWLRAAAAGKHPQAQLLLGMAQLSGQWGCEVAPQKALSSIEKAAHQGLAEAQLEAARCHMMGIGTKVDCGKAQQWAAKAAGQGHQQAARLLASLENNPGSSIRKQWSREVKQAMGSVPQGLTRADTSGAMLERLLSSSSAAGMPQEVKDCMRDLHQLRVKNAAPTTPFRSHRGHPTGLTATDRFPLDQLLQYSHSPAVQPYIQAKMLLYTGLELCLERRQNELGYQALARGYALCHMVMMLPADMIGDLEQHLSRHPEDASAGLVHAMATAAMRGIAWVERRLGQLLPRLPQELAPHVLLLRAELRMWPQLSDYTDTEAALKLLPGDPEALYVRAAAMQRDESRTHPSSAVEASLRAFLAAAAPEHSKRPHGFYTLAFQLLQGRKSRLKDAEANEIESVYEAGLAAEAELPTFFLPVECGVKDLLEPMVTMLRLRLNKKGGGGGGAAHKGSGGSASSSTMQRGSSSSTGSCCDRCGVAAAKLMRCSRCQARRFCSKECQVADWKEGHSKTCGK